MPAIEPGLTLDFTEVAHPITIGWVKLWVDQVERDDILTVSKIRLWQHQLNWLVLAIEKQHGERPAERLIRGEYIWGIPLEVRS